MQQSLLIQADKHIKKNKEAGVMAVDPKYQKELREAIEKQPKLSVLDMGLWLTGAAVSWAGAAGVYVFMFARIGMLREAESAALAVQETWAILWSLPAFIVLFGSRVLCLIYPFQRFALFGRKGAVYEGSTHREVLGYPVFMNLSGAPEPVRKRVWKARKIGINVLVALAVCLYLLTWSWNARNVCNPDGSVLVYNGWGTVKTEYTPERVERLTLRISEPYVGRNNGQKYYELDFMIRFDNGKYFTFQMEEKTGDDLRYLRQLLELKNRFGPEIVRVEDTALLENLIADQNWTGEAETIARELFSVPEK